MERAFAIWGTMLAACGMPSLPPRSLKLGLTGRLLLCSDPELVEGWGEVEVALQIGVL
jgi:hypothetical protein